MSTIMGWLYFVLLLIGLGVAGGMVLAFRVTAYQRQGIREQAAKLQAEWQAFHTAQRLQAAFLDVRRAMWEEGIRQHRAQHYREPDER